MVNRVIATCAAALVCGAPRAGAQPIDPPHLALARVSRPPTVADFERMEPVDAASGMRRVEGFVQRFPDDGQPVSERTIVYAGYDADFLYVAFQCFDSEIGRIGAHVLPRDAFPNDEDTVAVHIDTFRDLKHAYGFQVNAHGVQTDGTYTEGQGWDLSWDTVWRSDATRTPRGYVVLFRIPFRSLRFPATDRQQWGIFFYRAIARKNEQVYWPACSTRVAARFRQAAILEGIEQVSPGRNLQAIPYVASRSFRALDTSPHGAAFVSKRADAAIGIDGKAVVRDSIVLDATVNPDFSQVESDQPQITVNRPFEVFFPEKRPFFLENAAYFATPIQLLFTRRIADPMIGGRATGRAGRYAVGAMAVDDRAPYDAGLTDRPAWFGAARVIRDVGRESSVGAFVSERSDGRASNTVGALDGRVKLGPNWFAAGQGVLSRAGIAATQSGGSALYASIVGSGRRFNYELDYNDRSPSFGAVDGFIPRIDLRSIDQTYSFRARPSGRTLKAWGPDLVVNRTWDYGGRPLDWSIMPRLEWQWPGTTTLDVYYTAARQTLRPGEVAAADGLQPTDVSRAGLTFTSAILPKVIGSGTFFAGRAPNITPPAGFAPTDGRIADATASATIRLTSSLMVDVSYLWDRLRDAGVDAPTYVNRITRVRVGEQFTRALALRAIVQYNQLTATPSRTSLEPARNLNYDVLFTYLTSPGTAIYAGANYNLADIDPRLLPTAAGLLRSPALNNTGWQVFTKLSYLLRR
jgi:Domain of unknown function (DUF5916)